MRLEKRRRGQLATRRSQGRRRRSSSSRSRRSRSRNHRRLFACAASAAASTCSEVEEKWLSARYWPARSSAKSTTMASRAPLSHEEPPLLALRRAPPPLLCGGMSLWRLLDGYRSRRQLGVLIYQVDG